MKKLLYPDGRGNGLPVMLLFFLISVQQLLPAGTGNLFGTAGDWYSQHTAVAETLRQAMLESGRLLPQYLPLGGGSSVYDFAYYGVLRPDVLLGCLFPEIQMKYFVAGYALLGIYTGGVLCFFWLKRSGIPRWFSFAGAVLLVSSSSFYQAHNQIMFVNYMPFLILALWGIERVFEKKGTGLLTVSVFLIAVHSFYYTPACLCAAGVYTIHLLLRSGEKTKEKWKTAGKLTGAFLLSLGMAMVLLLPVGIDILSTAKDGGRFADETMEIFDLGMSGLLYSPYSCGMTVLCLYCLLTALTGKGSRFLAGTLFICAGIPAVSLALNGFLYAREKILIPFVPLLSLICAETLWKLWTGNLKRRIFPLLLCLIPAFFSNWKVLVILDTVLLGVWMLTCRRSRARHILIKKCRFLLCLCFPAFLSLAVNGGGSWSGMLRELGISFSVNKYLEKEDSRQEWYSRMRKDNFLPDSRYRLEVTADSFVNSNLSVKSTAPRTSMYSSISNSRYGEFFYDTMKNAVSYNNRIALVAGENPCFAYFMGIRYLVTESSRIPEGYRVIKTYGDFVLAENPHVLPVCYGTSGLMFQKNYEELEFPDTLEALCSRAVVKTAESGEKDFESHFQETDPEGFFAGNGEEEILNLKGKKEKCRIPLEKSLSHKILILQFQVKSRDGGAVILSVNGVKNKLSSENAPYPNHNTTFTYVIDTGENMEELWIKASGGDYSVENLKIWQAEKKYFHQEKISIPSAEKTVLGDGTVFSGTVDMGDQGYFITSYPYREGYEILLDGKRVKGELVNTAFLGFPIQKGRHRIQITYEPPGYCTGRMVSGLSFGIWGLLLLAKAEKKIWNTRKKKGSGEKDGKERKDQRNCPVLQRRGISSRFLPGNKSGAGSNRRCRL